MVFWGFRPVWRGIDGLQGGLHKHTDRVRVPVNPAMGDRAEWIRALSGGGGRGGMSTRTPNSPAPGRGLQVSNVPAGLPWGSVVRRPPADAGDGVRSLVREDPTCCRAAKSGHHNR